MTYVHIKLEVQSNGTEVVIVATNVNLVRVIFLVGKMNDFLATQASVGSF